jgi:hypothetical protein
MEIMKKTGARFRKTTLIMSMKRNQEGNSYSVFPTSTYLIIMCTSNIGDYWMQKIAGQVKI